MSTKVDTYRGWVMACRIRRLW